MNTLQLGHFSKTVVVVGVLSVAANFVLNFVGRMISNPPGFAPYMYGNVATLTVVGVIGAAIVYFAFRWFIADTRKANRYYIILSVVLCVVSFYPDLMLPYSSDPDQVGWTYDIMVNLMVMHVATAALVLYFFTKEA